jgi:hypothetical protein
MSPQRTPDDEVCVGCHPTRRCRRPLSRRLWCVPFPFFRGFCRINWRVVWVAMRTRSDDGDEESVREEPLSASE